MKLADLQRQPLNESISVSSAWQLFDHLEHELGINMLKPEKYGQEVHFDRDIAMHIALQLIGSYKLNSNGGYVRENLRFTIEAEHELSKLRLLYGSLNNEVGRIVEHFDKLNELGLDMPEAMKQQHQAAIDLSAARVDWEAAFEMVGHITSFVDGMISLMRAEKTDDYKRSIIRASLKQLGAFA